MFNISTKLSLILMLFLININSMLSVFLYLFWIFICNYNVFIGVVNKCINDQQNRQWP